MERRSEKHNPRLDDEMKRETESLVRGSPIESRAEEFREQEAPGNGEPTPDSFIAPDEVNERAELARWLNPSAFPGDRDSLLGAARSNHAPQAVLDELESLPGGRQFVNVEGVWSALGGEVGERRA